MDLGAKGIERERAGVHVDGTHDLAWVGKDAEQIRGTAEREGSRVGLLDIQSSRR